MDRDKAFLPMQQLGKIKTCPKIILLLSVWRTTQAEKTRGIKFPKERAGAK